MVTALDLEGVEEAFHGRGLRLEADPVRKLTVRSAGADQPELEAVAAPALPWGYPSCGKGLAVCIGCGSTASIRGLDEVRGRALMFD